ncbi:hypothetical protein FXO38_01655 [Capsicum annuum]|nr:hypothetical protein FXO38_01655 [Capsicum annuum]KAF3683807.1 hypothetical protein FXO37_01672 [Capsicum annuum]
MDYPDEVSHPTMFRLLATKSNTKVKKVDLFNPPDDEIHLLQVVHPRIVTIEEESLMTSYITLGHVDTIVDPKVELIRKELAGETTIRRSVRQGQPNAEALHDQPTKADLGASSGRVVGVGGRHVDASTTCDDDMLKNSLPYKRKLVNVPKAYDAADRIMDLDFCKKLKATDGALPILLRESKLINHLPNKVLMKKSWDFKDQNDGMILPKNYVDYTRGSYALAHIECLMTSTEMTEPMTFLCNNTVANLQEVGAYEVLTGRLEPVYIEEPVK